MCPAQKKAIERRKTAQLSDTKEKIDNEHSTADRTHFVKLF